MKKVFLALMAIAAIALTGCKGEKSEEPTNAALEYAKLCDKLINLSMDEVIAELTDAGWEQATSGNGAFILKGKRSDYEEYAKNQSSKNLIALGAIISAETNNKISDLCNKASVLYVHSDLSKAKSAVVTFSDYVYNKGVDQDLFFGYVDDTEYNEYKDYASFIQDVKDQNWKRVGGAMMKGDNGFSISGSKDEDKEGVVSYLSTYVSRIIDEED